VTEGQEAASQSFCVSIASAAKSLSFESPLARSASERPAAPADQTSAAINDRALSDLFADGPLSSPPAGDSPPAQGAEDYFPATDSEGSWLAACVAQFGQTDDLDADSLVDPGPDAGLAPFAHGAAGPAAREADGDIVKVRVGQGAGYAPA
jgi:hypothetical protein